VSEYMYFKFEGVFWVTVLYRTLTAIHYLNQPWTYNYDLLLANDGETTQVKILFKV